MKIKAGYYVINHYYPEVTRKSIAEVVQIIMSKENLDDCDIKVLHELIKLFAHYSEKKLELHSAHQVKLLESLMEDKGNQREEQNNEK